MDEEIRLLIVDDEAPFLRTIAERLRLRGFAVTTAERGEDALETARREKFDLALIDLKMPGIGGRHLLEMLKDEHRFLEGVVLTGHGSLESAVECTKLGAFGYLPKPYEIDGLLGVLKDAYHARLEKKFRSDSTRMARLEEMARGQSALGILREMRTLDDGRR